MHSHCQTSVSFILLTCLNFECSPCSSCSIFLSILKGKTALAMVEQSLSSPSTSSTNNEKLIAIRDLLRQEMIRQNLLPAHQRSARHTRPNAVSSSKQTAFIVDSSSEEDSPQHRPVAVISPIRRRTSLMVVCVTTNSDLFT